MENNWFRIMKYIRKLFIIFTILFSISVLTSCNSIKDQLANRKEYTLKFFSYISNNDYDTANDMLHPHSPITSLKTKINIYESRYNFSIEDTLEIYDTVSWELTGYSTQYAGSTTDIEYKVKIGDVKLYLKIFLVNNNAGKGMFDFSFSS